jgi:serine-type D-Ala-D-Ala endopeptidase (penicillin-binding protein 7)
MMLMFKLAFGALCSVLLVALSATGVHAVEVKAGVSAPHKQVAKRVAKKTRMAPRHTRDKRLELRAKRKLSYHIMVRAVSSQIAKLSAGDMAGLNLTRDPLDLKSSVALVIDQNNSEILFEKNANVALPIASITKLMTGLIVVEAQQDMNEVLVVTDEDVDREKSSRSRLRVGSQLTRGNMLHIALMSSENRAASALGRSYPGGLPAFVAAMNAKAVALHMTAAHYVDANGLSSLNVASASDLAKLAIAAYQQPLLRQYSTDPKSVVDASGRPMQYNNTNYLVADPSWEIGLQKTGYISEAGRCLLMQTVIDGRAVIMVFLDSKGKLSRTADAGRIRKWLEALKPPGLS